MDIEFHYSMTYLIAARAGFTPAQAVIIAHAAQSVDDNHIPVRLIDKNKEEYVNSISQTMDILRPHEDAAIYPIFHFIPGIKDAPSAKRKDGKTHPWNTTPDSPLANQMIDAALRSGDLYRIGVSAHGNVDTWAHQNFVGRRDSFNQFESGFFAQMADRFLAVGHAHAKHNPDWPALVWEDARLESPTVDNKARFLEAAKALFSKFAKHLDPRMPDAAIAAESAALAADLASDIGPRDDANSRSDERIAAYARRGAMPAYGRAAIPPYVLGTWFSEAIAESRDEVIDKMRSHLNIPVMADIVDFAKDVFADGNRQLVTWRNPDPRSYKGTNWFKFQEAVKSHLAECEGFLKVHLGPI